MDRRRLTYILPLAVLAARLSVVASGAPVFGQERTATPPPARKSLEYVKCSQAISGCIGEEDEWAQLDSVGHELRANFNLHAYVVGHAARGASPGSGLRHANYVRNLLRRFVADDARVSVTDGGRREHLTIEVWLAPPGVTPPAPSAPVLTEVAGAAAAFRFDEFYPSDYREDEAHFGEYKYYDQSAMLDGFALLLERQPKLKGYIIAFDGRRDRTGTAYKFARRYWQYLYDTNLLGNNPNVTTSEPSRIMILRGGRRSGRLIELWAVPHGASPPTSSAALRGGRSR